MNAHPRSKSRATEFDRQVGGTVRARRIVCGVSQRRLAAAIGVRVQQLQKYEAGVNRMSPARLRDAAALLGVTVADLFAGAGPPPDPVRPAREEGALLTAFRAISSKPVQRALAALTRAIAATEKPT